MTTPRVAVRKRKKVRCSFCVTSFDRDYLFAPGRRTSGRALVAICKDCTRGAMKRHNLEQYVVTSEGVRKTGFPCADLVAGESVKSYLDEQGALPRV